jgi:hypothetical protein
LDPVFSQMTGSHFAAEAAFVQETYRLIERMKGQPFSIRKNAWKQRVDEMRRSTFPIITFLSSPIQQFDEAATRGQTKRNAYQCLTAVRLWQLEHGQLPNDLAAATNAAGMPEVPSDPYSNGRRMGMAFVNNRLLIYSVGSDGIDHGGRQDWKFGQQPGDFLFPLP